MTRLFARLRRDEGGASIVELALVMPFFAALIMGVADLSRAYSTKLQLEQAAYRAVEKVQQYQSSEDTATTLKTEAALAAGVTETSTNPLVSYTLECNGVAQADYDTVCTSGQTYTRRLTVDITKTFTPMFASSRWPGSNANGTYTLHGRAGLRTQ